MCWWIFHNWGLWLDITITDTWGDKLAGQNRYCMECNKRQIRRC